MQSTPRVLTTLTALILVALAGDAYAAELQVDQSADHIPGVLTRQDHMMVGSALRLNDMSKLESVFAKRHDPSAMTKKVRKLHKKGKAYLSSADQKLLNEALLTEMTEGRTCDREVIGTLVGLGANAALNRSSETDSAIRSQAYQCSTELLIESIAVARDEDERLERLSALGMAVAEDMVWYLKEGRRGDADLQIIRNMRRFSGVYNQVSSTLKKECLRNQDMCIAAGATLAVAQGIGSIKVAGNRRVKTAFKGVQSKVIAQGRNLKLVAQDQLADFQAQGMAQAEAIRGETVARVVGARDEAMGRANEARDEAASRVDDLRESGEELRDEAQQRVAEVKSLGKKAKKKAKKAAKEAEKVAKRHAEIAKQQAAIAKRQAEITKAQAEDAAEEARAVASNAAEDAKAQAKQAKADAAAAVKDAKKKAKKDSKKMIAKSTKKASKSVSKFGKSMLR